MDSSSEPEAPNALHKILVVIGSAGLLLAMATDAVAVLGRHSGFAVIGSIEVFQVAAVVALSCAVLLVSLLNRHATVDLLLGRASEPVRHILMQFGRVALAITFGMIALGSAWVAADLWGTSERTELLAIRLAPLRIIWIASVALSSAYFALAFVRGFRR